MKFTGQFEYTFFKGWLMPYLFVFSEIFHKRWSYWFESIENVKECEVI
jgi:hypothetical protein